MAVRKAVSAATITFTATSTIRFFITIPLGGGKSEVWGREGEQSFDGLRGGYQVSGAGADDQVCLSAARYS